MTISVIGAGRIGLLLEEDPYRYKPCTHLGAIFHIIKKQKKNGKDSITLDTVCDLIPQRLDVCHNYFLNHKSAKSLHTNLDYKEALKRNPDILVIATDTSTHCKIALDSIQAGIPRLVIEKPLGLSRREVDSLFNLAQKKNTHIWINYERRYHNKYRALKTLSQSGLKYGKLIHYCGWFASSNTSVFKTGMQNEGALLHDTTHMVDLVQFIFGKIIKNRGETVSTPGKSRLHRLSLQHDHDLAGEIWTTTSNLFFHFELELLFEKGRIVVGNGFYREESLQKSKLYKDFISLGDPQHQPDKKMKIVDNPLMKLYDDVIHDRYDASYFADACDNVRILTR